MPEAFPETGCDISCCCIVQALSQTKFPGGTFCAPLGLNIMHPTHVQEPAVAMVYTKVRSIFRLPNVF